METSFKTLLVASLAAFFVVGFAIAPAAEAARGGGAGARAAGGGGASRQINTSSRDARANDVRSTSVNNVNSSRSVSRDVNVDRDVNIDIDVDHGHGGWDHDYHPVATAAVIAGTAAVIGSIVNTIPPSCVPINYGGMIYQQCGGTWYAPQGAQYVVVNPPY